VDNIQPLGPRVTLKTPESPAKIGSIWVPEEAKDTYSLSQGEVVAVGAGVSDPRIQPGLRVIVKRFGAFSHDAERTLWTTYESGILAVIDETAL
jgi:co-chaperonin GroES (HSP10)